MALLVIESGLWLLHRVLPMLHNQTVDGAFGQN
jgi:hypothetical protein